MEPIKRKPSVKKPRADRVAQIRELAARGLTAKQISEEMQFDQGHVNRIAREDGIAIQRKPPMPPGNWVQHEETGFFVDQSGRLIGRSGRPLRPFPDKNGYLRVNICLDGRWKQLSVHRIVCEVFHGPKPEWADLVAHADGNPSNCSASNLRWATFLQNEEDKRRHGRTMEGESHHRHKLTEDQVKQIRSSTESASFWANKLGIHEGTVRLIRNRKTWRHL